MNAGIKGLFCEDVKSAQRLIGRTQYTPGVQTRRTLYCSRLIQSHQCILPPSIHMAHYQQLKTLFIVTDIYGISYSISVVIHSSSSNFMSSSHSGRQDSEPCSSSPRPDVLSTPRIIKPPAPSNSTTGKTFSLFSQKVFTTLSNS